MLDGAPRYLSGGQKMEFFVGAAVIIMLLLLAGVELWFIFLGIILLAAAAGVFTAGFFAVCAVMLIRANRCIGSFVRFEKNGRFDAAVYSVNGKEYKNVFPAEVVMRGKLYSEGKPAKLYITKGGRCFDKNAFVTTAAGLPTSLVVTAAAIMLFLFFAAV
ncbi:MAG: hypothetical protein ACI4XA_04970 [Oscillospiraceae bacterium]